MTRRYDLQRGPFPNDPWQVVYRVVTKRCPATGYPLTFTLKRLPYQCATLAAAQAIADALNQTVEKDEQYFDEGADDA